MLIALHEFPGSFLGPRIARKHVGWYLKEHEQASEFAVPSTHSK